MAEGGEDCEAKRRHSSGQNRDLQGLDVSSTTKEEALGILQGIPQDFCDLSLRQHLNELTKTLENSKNRHDLLCPAEREAFSKIIKASKNAKPDAVSDLELRRQFGRQLALDGRSWPFLEIQGNISNPVLTYITQLEDTLTNTRKRLQEAVEHISHLNNELNHVRAQQSDERIALEKDLRSIREEKRKQEQSFQKEINLLKQTIEKLRNDKEELENQIRDLRIRQQQDEAEIAKFKQEQKALFETLADHNMKAFQKTQEEIGENQQEIGDLKIDVQHLMEENQKLKTRHPFQLVGYGVTLMANALYKHVHQPERLRKNYYAIDTLENHLETRYNDDEERRRDARGRWEEIQRLIGWSRETQGIVNNLADYREKGRNTMNVGLGYPEFSEAVRLLLDQGEIDPDEAETIRDLFTKCKANIPPAIWNEIFQQN